MLLHEWMYDLASRLCVDRDYLYHSYIVHFGALTREIFAQGRTQCEGLYLWPGMKSGLTARITWKLARRLDFVRLNEVFLDVEVRREANGELFLRAELVADLSTGGMRQDKLSSID